MKAQKRYCYTSQSPPKHLIFFSVLKVVLFILFTVVFLTTSARSLYAQNDQNKMRFYEYPNQNPVTDFELDLKNVEISAKDIDGVHRALFQFSGKYNLPEGNLLINIRSKNAKLRRIQIHDEGKFEKEIILPSEITDFEIVSVNIHGEIQRKWYRLEIKNWLDLVAPERQTMSTFFSAGLGITSNSYKDSRISPYSQITLTPKLNFGKELFRKKMNIGANLYFSAFSLSKNQDAEAHFFGINVRAGYLLPFIPYPWSLSLMGGLYYTTMFVSTNGFGFQNMAGPQFYPYLRYLISKTKNLGFYAKFSPIGENFSLLGLSNREIAAGMSYQFKLKNQHFMSVSLDWAQIDLEITKVLIQTNSITVGASYSF